MSKEVESRTQIEKNIKRRETWLKFLSLFAILVLVAGLAVFVYLQATDETRRQLADPVNIRVEQLGSNYILSFDEVLNASAYRFSINGVEQQVNADTRTIDITHLVQTPQMYSVTVQAIGSNGYKNSNVVRGDDFAVYGMLDQPVMQLDKYDSKLVWLTVDGADSYEVSITIDNDLNNIQTERVVGNEFDISEVVVDFTREYSFTVRALSNNEFIYQSNQSQAVNDKLQGRLSVPQNVAYDESTQTLFWQPVQNAETYTVVLNHGTTQEKRFIASTDSYTFTDEDLTDIGAYSVYVYANNVQGTSSTGQTTWFLASDHSEVVNFSVYKQLETPTNLQYQMNDSLIWFTWDAVPNAMTYVIELLNADGEKYYEYTTTGANQIDINRNVAATLGNIFRMQVKANGYGYYLTSEYSNILELDASDQFAQVNNIEVIENGKYLTFSAPGTNVSGTLNVLANNGYHIKITDEDGVVVFEGNTMSTLLDTSNIFNDIVNYTIEITVNAYSFLKESQPSTTTYAHQIVLGAPYNVRFALSDTALNVMFDLDREVTNFAININGIDLDSSLYTLSDHLTYTQNTETGVYNYVLNFSTLYNTVYVLDPLLLAQKFTIKLKALGNIAIDDTSTPGFKDSAYSQVATYENRIKLQTPQFIRVDNLGGENVILYFTQVENATSYLIELESVTSGNIYRLTSRLTTVNIYDVISAGNNKITITAVGTGYYTNSDPSPVSEYFYSAILSAPENIQVVEEQVDGSTHIFVQFNTTRFAEYYKIQIRQIQKVENGVVEDIESKFVLLGDEFEAGEGITRCDITDYLLNSTFGRFELQVRAVVKQPIAVESNWSELVHYNYYNKPDAPTNLRFDDNTNILTFDGVETALNGYVVRVRYALGDGTYSTHEITTMDTSLDLTEEIQSRGGLGLFVIDAMTLRVDELFLRNSDWSNSIDVTKTYQLSAPTNFEFNEQTFVVSWVSDINMQYETLTITFSNSSQTNLVVESIGAEQGFNTSVYGMRNLTNTYGNGYYKFTVQSFSNQPMVEPSSVATYTYTQFVQLDSPVLIEVVDRNNRVEATFTTVENAYSYAIIAKLPTQNSSEWQVVLDDILDDGNTQITVDIKQALTNFMGANRYDIAVIANSYEYFTESEPSNSLQYDLWLTFSAPIGLDVQNVDGKYIAVWNAVPYAVNYTLTIDSVTVSSEIATTSYDLSEVLAGVTTGHFLLGVRVNATGYYYASPYTTFDFYLTQQLQTPVLSYDEPTYVLTISGQGDGVGYEIKIDYFNSLTQYESAVPTDSYTVSGFVGTQLNLRNQMQQMGLGIYNITVREIGDGTFWQDSEWSEPLMTYYTEALNALTMFNVDKRDVDQDGQFEYYMVISKDSNPIYTNALVEYKFYEVDSIDATLQGDETPVLTLYSAESEFLIEGLDDAKYYIVVATVLGAYENEDIYRANGNSDTLAQTLAQLAYYTNSAESSLNFSTIGNLLGAPIITSIEMVEDSQLQITFNTSLNAQAYTLMVTRQSQNQVIYNSIIDAENEDAVIGENSIAITIPVVLESFVDEYDIYNIILYANRVYDDDGVAVLYEQSPNTEVDFEYITTLDAPSVVIDYQDGTLRISASQVQFATAYVFEVNINGFVQEHNVGDAGYLEFANAQNGEYRVRAKALGDEYHKDSDYGAYEQYVVSQQLDGVDEVRIVSNSDDPTLVTRIYAEWDAVEGATQYGVKITKDSADVGEYTTSRTYFDLLDIFREYGYGTYTVYVKTKGDGQYVVGEEKYTASATYTFKGQFEIPANLQIDMDEQDATIIYTVSFDEVVGAQAYILKFYSVANPEASYTLRLNATDLAVNNGKASADISSFLAGIDGGEYNVTIQVAETNQNNASDESEAIEFTNYHKHDDPNMRTQPIGDSPVLRLEFNDVDFSTGYKLLINGVPYLVNDSEVFSYPASGYLDIYATYLNVGGQDNIFTLIVLGDSNYYYLDSTFTHNAGEFSFRLDEVDNVYIQQTDKTTIPNGELSRVVLTFNQVDFADYYELYIDNVSVGTLEVGLQEYDLWEYFKDRMPQSYKVSLVAKSNQSGITQSYETEYNFNYVLEFREPSNLYMSDSSLTLNWGIPANYESFLALAELNKVEIAELEYEVKVYYISTAVEQLIVEGLITTFRSYDLTEYLTEPGAYRLEVYTCANAPFNGSSQAATLNYSVVIKLDAVTNVAVNYDPDSQAVLLSFTKVELKDYKYAVQNIYYDIYINGSRAVGVVGTATTDAINITEYLWGGDNIIYVITRDVDTTHFEQSDPSESVDYNYSKAFLALNNLYVYNDTTNNAQYLRFDRFTVTGLTQDDINALTYTVTVYNTLTSELIGTDANMTATNFNSTIAQIDISKFINNTPGTYTVVAKINTYTTQKVTEAGTVSIIMTESVESQTEYTHKLQADMLELSLLVIDVEGNERDPQGGLEMSEMWLTFDVNLSDDYIYNVDELLYSLMINQSEFSLTIPFGRDLIGQMVTATGNMFNGSQVQEVSTQVAITSYIENEIEKVSLSISIIPLLQASGFNIYMSGQINLQARSQEQGYYLASNYQTDPMSYHYMLKYLTPTGLELVEREDGLHYIKWDEPIHEHIDNYYSIVEEYNVLITSEGVINSSGMVTNPHDTQGGSHSMNFKPTEIIAENGFLYYLVEDILFAGHNTISLKCNGSEFYLESDTCTITRQPFIKQLKTPEFTITDLDVNLTGNDLVNKGVEISILNYDGVEDYDDELNQIVNYNQDALYRLTITSQSQGFADVYNPTAPTYMNYSIDFRVNRNGIVEVYSGSEYLLYNRVSFSTSDNQGRLRIIWTLDQPGEYTYTLVALGNDLYYTSNSEASQIVHRTTYNAPDLQLTVSVYHNFNGAEVSRSQTQTTKISKIELYWQTELSRFYGASYTINIVGTFNGGETTSADCLNNIVVTNNTSITFSPTENADVFEIISKRPAYYTFYISSNEMQAEAYLGAESVENGIMTYYMEYTETGRAPVQKTYDYLLKINTPEEFSVHEVGELAYIKTRIPQYFIDAGIEENLNQIFVTYTLRQMDPSYILGQNVQAKVTTNNRAPVLLYDSVQDGEPGYYYIDITGLLTPSTNQITLSFNAISEQNFVSSDSVVFEYNYVITLQQVTSVNVQNFYDSNHYVSGFLVSFNNVEYNKYFSYLLEIDGTQYNETFHKVLLLKIDPSRYVSGSQQNYRYVTCYDVTSGVQQQVVVGDIYLRTEVSNSYTYTRTTYTPAQSSTSFNNLLTFAVVIEGGLPDRYDFTITTLGELNQDGTSNEYISDLPIAQATTSASPCGFTHIMKGTLRNFDVEIGTMSNNSFVQSSNNGETSHLAYVYDNDSNGSDSIIYLNYNPRVGANGLIAYDDNIVLRIELEDTQALAYSLHIRNASRNTSINLNSYSQFVNDLTENAYSNVIVEYLNGEYAEKFSAVSAAMVDGHWVIFVDLMALNGGIFTQNGLYQITVRAHNENTIVNDLNRNESLYDNSSLVSNARFGARYDKVYTPQVSFIENGDTSNSEYGVFEVTNFTQINNILDLSVPSNAISYSIIVQYRLAHEQFSSSNQIAIQSSEFNSDVGIVGNKFIIKETYLTQRLNNLDRELGRTYVRIIFEVDETTFIWNSEPSDGDASFLYRAYIDFVTFARTENEYDYGGYTFGTNVYSAYTYNTNTRELATRMNVRYSLDATSYVQNESGWRVVIGVWFDGYSSRKAEWTISRFGQSNVNVIEYISNQNSGFLAEAFANANKALKYGKYTVNMQILRIETRTGQTVGSSQVIFDQTIYQRTFTIKAKLKPLSDVTLTMNSDETEITRATVYPNTTRTTYLKTESSVLNEVTFVIEIYRESYSNLVETLYIRNLSSLSYSHSRTISPYITDSGTYWAEAYIRVSGSGDTQYIESSNYISSPDYLIPYVMGIFSVELEVDDTNQVDLTISLYQAINYDADGASDFEDALSNNIANSVEYELNLIRLSDGNKVLGNSSDIVQKTFIGTIADLEMDLTDEFNSLVNNVNRNLNSSFIPGSYVIKIRTADDYTYGSTTYEQSNYYYANASINNGRKGGTTCNTYNITSLTSSRKTTLNNLVSGFECIYNAGYEDWDPSNMEYLRNSWSHMGYVSDVRVPTITDGNNAVLPFLKYGINYSIYDRPESVTSGGSATILASRTQGYVNGYSTSLMISLDEVYDSADGDSGAYVTTYSSASDMESNESVGVTLKVNINTSHTFLDEIGDYVKMRTEGSEPESSNSVLYYSGNETVRKSVNGRQQEVAQYVAKQQRLPAPTNVRMSMDEDDGGPLGESTRDYTITWSMNRTYRSSTSGYKVIGLQRYESIETLGDALVSIFTGVTNGIIAHSFSPGLSGVLSGPIVAINSALDKYASLTERGNTVMISRNDNVSGGNTLKHTFSQTHGWDWSQGAWTWPNEYVNLDDNFWGFADDAHCVDSAKWIWVVQAKSSTPLYGDSDYGTYESPGFDD